MINKLYIKLLKRLLRFGPVKGTILYFLCLIVLGVVFFIVYSCVFVLFAKKSFGEEWSDNNLWLLFYLVMSFFSSFKFYEDANKEVQGYMDLENKGLTPEDILRINFTRDWAETRKVGLIKYCLYNGGIITGMILFFPVSFIMFLFSGSLTAKLPDFSVMVIFILEGMVGGYLCGAIAYRIRWAVNEKKFTRLTDPIQ